MTLEVANRKLETFNRLALLDDDAMFLLILQLLKGDKEQDWAESLTPTQKSDLEEGLADARAGRVENYEAFERKMKLKYP
jgi:hypothetical protein